MKNNVINIKTKRKPKSEALANLAEVAYNITVDTLKEKTSSLKKVGGKNAEKIFISMIEFLEDNKENFLKIASDKVRGAELEDVTDIDCLVKEVGRISTELELATIELCLLNYAEFKEKNK